MLSCLFFSDSEKKDEKTEKATDDVTEKLEGMSVKDDAKNKTDDEKKDSSSEGSDKDGAER